MDPAKQAAGEAAAGLVSSGMRLGLGTGSTVAYFLEALAARGLEVTGVPTSEATAARCRELGIGLIPPEDADRLDLCVDGADELDRELNLTKGGGGALLREKVVASLADRMVVIATVDKLVDRLGESFPLPVEVVPFALGPVRRRLEGLGFEVSERRAGGVPQLTDNGNVIVDCRMRGGIEDPAVLEATLAMVPGIAESGLFVGLASLALLGAPDGSVERVEPTSD
ncbi:MAG: ribose-5-phosphate isomerase RpiA [Actinobacteria bacterium]|nr:ribose-5-phosphate isomerase RpiA [Actinomycetota bacterium]